MELLWIAAVAAALLSVLVLFSAVAAFRRRRVAGGAAGGMLGILLLSISALMALVAVGMSGFHALTRETVAAIVEIDTLAPQRFAASFTLADGSVHRYELAGDELYVDARVIKWHPRANLVGLHTAYQLDRVAGRYSSLDDERTAPRTVFTLSEEPRFDLFEMARRYPFLSPLVDAEYGSATFLPVADGGRYEVRVSTSGLLIRPVGDAR